MDNLTSDDFETFWSACIEEHLAKQHWEKKYIAVDTLSYAFARAKEIHLSLFLQGETVRCIRNGLSEYKHPAREFLAKISQQFCLSVKQLLESNVDDEKYQKMILISMFKFFPRTKGVCRAVLKSISRPVMQWFLDWWIDFWVSGADSKFDMKLGESVQARRWLLQILSASLDVRGREETPQESIWIKPLRILIVTSLFVAPEKVSKKCKVAEVKRLPDLQEAEEINFNDVQNAIQNVINKDSTEYLAIAFDFARECSNQKGVKLRTPFDEVPQDVWNRLCDDATLTTAKNHKYSSIVIPLLHQCGFNMLSDGSANAEALNDIINLVENDELGDDWLPALVELMISFFVNDNRKIRALVLSCFRQINTKLTRKSIQVCSRVVNQDDV